MNFEQENLLTAMIAGSAAATGATIGTYPFEYLKTATQLHRYIDNKTLQIFGSESNVILGQVFRGCGTLALGNSLKASTRFLVYNWATKFMSNEHGKTSAPRIVIAGAMSGIAESLWIIPFENIKTLLIENTLLLSERRSGTSKKYSSYEYIDLHAVNEKKPNFKLTSEPITPRNLARSAYNRTPSESMIHAIKEIYQTRGLRGFAQGGGATLFRQVMNSGVWFSVYNSLRQIANPHNTPNAYLSFLLGAVSSVAVIVVTQPIDVVKTRLQSKNGKELYRDSMTCAFRICYEEGLKTLWTGWAPRLFKVSVTGGITLSIYDQVSSAVNIAINENPFAAE